MKIDLEGLLKTKTFWTALLAIATAGVAFGTGEINLATFAGAIFAAVQTINLRDGQLKIGQ
jgi:hypothetical protein